MTTIAYNHKDQHIAVDSRVACGDLILTDEGVKFRYDKANLFFFTGKLGDCEKLIESFNCGFIDGGADCAAFAVFNGEVYWVNTDEKGYLQKTLIEHNCCLGRGDEVALTAMDYGATAKGAVEQAAKRTTSTGGLIRVYDIKTAKFLD